MFFLRLCTTNYGNLSTQFQYVFIMTFHQCTSDKHMWYLFITCTLAHFYTQVLTLETHTLCFLKFLVRYALIPNTKPIMLIILYLVWSKLTVFCRLICDNLLGNVPSMIALFQLLTFLCSGQTSYNYTRPYYAHWTLEKYMYSVDHMITL